MANPYRKFLDPRVLAELKGLELRTTRIVDGFLSGRNRTRARGMSNEFVQHREYSPGDDVRRIDWRVFGRTDKYHLKQFQDESNLVLYLALDTSESMSYQGPGASLSKSEYAKCLIAALAWIAQTETNSVGMILFDQEIHSYCPPTSDSVQIADLLSKLEVTFDGKKTDFKGIQRDFVTRLNKKGIVFVVSDFFDQPDRVLTLLRSLSHAGHDVVAQQILAPAETDFPFRKTTRFRGLESSSDVVLAPQRIRRAYLRKIEAFIKTLRKGCSDVRIEFHQNVTTDNFGLILSALLKSRMRIA